MTKKTVLFLLILFFSFRYGYSQNNKSIIASVQYKVIFKNNKKVLIDDVCQLDITKTKSYFYSKGELENLHRIDEKAAKGKRTGNSIDLGQIDSKEMLQNLCYYKILKDFTSKKALYIQYVGSQNLGFVKDSLSTKRWEILKGTDKINGLLCHKAIMKKDTTLITAWFCTDVPLQDGPFYYYGLPGLIVKATSSAGFEATLTSISYNKDPKKEIVVVPYALVSEAQMMKAMEIKMPLLKMGIYPMETRQNRSPLGIDKNRICDR